MANGKYRRVLCTEVYARLKILYMTMHISEITRGRRSNDLRRVIKGKTAYTIGKEYSIFVYDRSLSRFMLTS